MHLLLLRHGESIHGIEHTVAQATCKGLTQRGKEQAEQLAQCLKTEPCDVLLSTSVQRAYETASIISARLNQPIQVNDDLTEIMPGDADGLSSEAYQDRFGEFDLVTHPDRPFAPNGETWNDYVARVETALTRLAERYVDQNVIAVTHAGFIVVSFLRLFGIAPGTNRAWLNPAHTSITEWQVIDDRWQLNRYNDTNHL